jgi:Tol biopolymer transport system component/DNA-binding winged helix-turn-helix (wHTH) protein
MKNGTVATRKFFVFRFADVEVHEREFRVVKAGEVLPVEPKAFSLLLFLLRNPERLISKEELLDTVWKDAEVTEHSLTRTIAKLRRLLEDDFHEPRYIATVSKVGYRFVSKVEVVEDRADGGQFAAAQYGLYVVSGAQQEEQSPPQEATFEPLPAARERRETESPKSGGTWGIKRWWVFAGLAMAAGAALLGWFLHRTVPALRVSEYKQITHDGQKKAVFGTDGTRLFFNRYPSEQPLAEVSISGGQIAQIPLPLPEPWVFDVSPDGTALLAVSNDKSRGSLWSVGTAGSPLRHLADGARDDIFGAAWSPDGNSVAYSTMNGDLHVARLDGTGARVLASVPYRTSNVMFEQISWSPDGRTIRFDRNNRIYEVSPDGSGAHPFLNEWHPSSWQCCGRWTADGRFFLFLMWNSPMKAYPLFPPYQIWAVEERPGVFRKAPSEPFQLTSGPIRWGRPVPSRDGKTIFGRGIHLNGELVRLDAKTNQFQAYLGGVSAEGLSFSPDGRSVAYVTYPEGVLWRANLDGSNPMQLTDPPLYPSRPRWSPDGSQILFSAADIEGKEQGYLVSSQGGAPRPLLPGYEEYLGDPSWSPDGHLVAFESYEGQGDTNPVSRILDLATHQVTTLPGEYWSPRWSPDGRTLAGLSHDSGELALFDLNTRRWSVLLKEAAGYPSWSHDGQFIYFLRLSEAPGVYRIRRRGGQAERIVDLTGFHHAGIDGLWMGLDPDDNPLLLRNLGGDDIYALALEEK